MDEKIIDEIKEVVAHSSGGNWMPFGIVCGCLALVMVLFIYILNMKDKANQIQHSRTDGLLEKLTENSTAMNTMIAVHETEIENLKTYHEK